MKSKFTLRFIAAFMFQMSLMLAAIYAYEMTVKPRWFCVVFVLFYIYMAATNLWIIRSDGRFTRASQEVDRHVEQLNRIAESPVPSYTALEHHNDQAACALDIMKLEVEINAFKFYWRKPKLNHEQSK